MTFSDIREIISAFDVLKKATEKEKNLVLKTITLSAMLGEEGLNSANFLNFEDQATLVFSGLELAKCKQEEELLVAMINLGIHTVESQTRSSKLPAMQEKYSQAGIDLDEYFVAYLNILKELKELLLEAMQ